MKLREAVVDRVAGLQVFEIKTDVSYYAFSTQARHICNITHRIWKQPVLLDICIRRLP